VQDLIVRDWAQYWLREPCPACATPLGGAGVEIRNGVIQRGWLTQRDELPGEGDYFLPDPSGALIPFAEEEHHMPIRDDC